MSQEQPSLNLADYEALAPARMHPAVWDFIAAGADDGVTMAENRRAFERTQAVMVGRPVLWGLAVAGAAGAQDVLEMLKRELELAMAIAGRPTLASVDASLILRR
jgi:isopentenyl diphosphate isomerase/L-lactate dehydrogenase-like FMN-dependent dehydrogenase